MQSVNQIYGIRASNDPQDRQGNRELAGIEHGVVLQKSRIRHHMDHDTVVDGDGCSYDLNRQLYQRRQIHDIIDSPHDHDNDGSNQDAFDLIGNVCKQDHSYDKSEKDGQSAHSGDGMVVNTPCFRGHIDSAHLLGEHLHDRGCGQCDKKGYQGTEADLDPDCSGK